MQMKETILYPQSWISAPAVDYGQDDAGYYQDHRNAILFNTFQAHQTDSCLLHLAVLGFYECRINGKPASTSVLNGPWTNYQKTVYYDTFDVSALLEEGENTIEVELGNGYYNPSPITYFGKYNLRKNLSEVGDPKMWLQLMVNDEIVLQSDSSWKAEEGNLLFNNLFLGEKVDFNLTDSQIHPVTVSTTPYPLTPSFMEPITRHQSIDPISVVENEQGLELDFGEMISGFFELDWNSTDNAQILCKFAERRNPDGSLNYFSNANGSVGEVRPDGIKTPGGPGAPEVAVEQDLLVSRPGENHFCNRFSYHSFRYVQIDGLKKEDLMAAHAIYVHTNVRQIGTVHTDNAFYNDLYDAALRTKLNNLHSSFEDCARERLGYGGDMVTLADSNLYTFDLKNVYEKIIIDFRNDQTPAGGFPETAPYMGIQSKGTAQGEGPLMWQYVYPYILNKLIQFYDDKEFVRGEYSYLKKNIDYLLSWDAAELSQHDLGDHGSILIMGQFYKPTPDKPLAGYCAILLFLNTFIKISHELGYKVSEYEKTRDLLKTEILERFANADGTFGEGEQTGIAFLYGAGVLNADQAGRLLIEKVKADHGIYNAGIFGTKFMYDLAHELGRDDLTEYWLTQDSDISFKKMLSNGSKAMAELFAGESYSDNHAMFTSFIQWYYEALGGIQIDKNAVGFDSIRVAPYFSKQINEVCCSIDTIHGRIESNWKRVDGKITWLLRVPSAIHYEILGDYDSSVELILLPA